MEGRQTRGRAEVRVQKTTKGKSPARKSPARKSPARKSPARKSPARKSPARATKPAARQDSPKAIRSRGTPLKSENAEKIKENNSEKKSSLTPTKLSPTVKLSPVKEHIKTSPSTHSVSTSYSSSTYKTTKTSETVNISATKYEDISGDSEISKLTSLTAFARRSLSKNLTPGLSSHHLTPTPTTEQSRHSRSVSRSIYDEDDDDNYSKNEYSDHENDNYEPYLTARGDNNKRASSYARSTTIARYLAVPQEFGGSIGALLLILLIPAITLYLQFSCNKNACKFKNIDVKTINIKSLDRLFSVESGVAYFLFTMSVFLISAVPMGRVVRLYSDRGQVQYYFNSIAAAVLAIIGLAVGEYLKYPVIDFIGKNYLRLCFLSLTSALILSCWLFLRSRYVSQIQWNPYAKSGRFLADFFIGREINPKWFQIVDIKLVHYRISLVVSLVLGLLLIYKNVQLPKIPEENTFSQLEKAVYFAQNTTFDRIALFSSIQHLVYISDLIFFEHHLTSSFELQHEGVGALLLLRYAATPFLLALVPKYVLDHKPIEIPTWAVALLSVTFAIGMLVKRLSNKLKYEYRMNPSNPKFNFADTLPTFQGRRLLLVGWWGVLRQPNYSGDILALLAMVAPLGWKFAWPPAVAIILIVVFLIHRAIRVNARNFARYNSAWTRYCARVRHLIIPKVF